MFDDVGASVEAIPEICDEICGLAPDIIIEDLPMSANVLLVETLSKSSLSDIPSSFGKLDSNNSDGSTMTKQQYRDDGIIKNEEEEDEYDYSEFDDDDDEEVNAAEYLAKTKSTAPITSVDPVALEAKLAKELNSLSLQQRDSALYEIHGVADAIPETPELIESSLRDLERQLQKQTRRKLKRSKAYRIAESQSPEYVRRKPFRLLFLKSRFFDVKAACSAIFLHFTVKRELFGEDKLSREITQKDLDEDDMACLSNGHFQLMPVCDTAGRYAVAVSMSHAKFKSATNFARVAWYSLMSMVRMDTSGALGKGVIGVIYKVGGRKKIAKGVPFTMRRVRNSMPFRVSSLHFCSEAIAKNNAPPGARDHTSSTNGNGTQRTRGEERRMPRSTFADWVLTFCLESAMRIRTRIHRGTHEQCLRSLEGFGIPSDLFPVTADGNLRRDRHRGWISSLKFLEEKKQQQGSSIITNFPHIVMDDHDDDETQSSNHPKQFLAPSQSDVLLGRGRASQTHIGNLRLRLMLETNMEQFESFSERGGKLQFAMSIVNAVKSSGGHFLKLEHGLWVSVSDHEACKKVAHDFRTLRTKQIIKADDVYSGDVDMDIDQSRTVIRKRVKSS